MMYTELVYLSLLKVYLFLLFERALRALLIFSVALTVEQIQDLRDVNEDREAQVLTLAHLGQRRARPGIQYEGL